MDGPVNLAHLVARLNQSMAHDLAVTVTLDSGYVVTGMIQSVVIDRQRKIDPSRRDRSNLIATIDGQVVEVERMRDVKLGS